MPDMARHGRPRLGPEPEVPGMPRAEVGYAGSAQRAARPDEHHYLSVYVLESQLLSEWEFLGTPHIFSKWTSYIKEQIIIILILIFLDEKTINLFSSHWTAIPAVTTIVTTTVSGCNCCRCWRRRKEIREKKNKANYEKRTMFYTPLRLAEKTWHASRSSLSGSIPCQ